jgi:glycosyltransferase involved in cell wall biosynthesis
VNIVVIYQYFGTPNGSWSTRYYEFARRWVSNGHKVTVITSPYNKSDLVAERFISHIEIEGIRIILINSGDNNTYTKLLRVIKSIVFSFTAFFQLAKIKSDVIIASSGPITVGIPALLCKCIFNRKFIFEIRDLWPAGGIIMGKINSKIISLILLKLEDILYKESSHIIALSEGQKNFIMNVNNLNNDKIDVIQNISDNHLFESNTDNVPFYDYFVHVGSLGFIHNVQLLVRAAVFLRDKGYTNNILIVGDGSEKNYLVNLCKTFQLTNVIFIGQVSKIQTAAYINNSIATIFTTLDNIVQNASSPNKIFDSFAASKPVIQTTTGWIKELVINEDCGINVIPEDPESLALAMIKYIENRDLVKYHSKNAKRLARNNFDVEYLSIKYLNIITNQIG